MYFEYDFGSKVELRFAFSQLTVHFIFMERAGKLRKLERFRRRLPYVSAAALAAILIAVKQHGIPDGGTNRNTYREARNFQACHADTPYGPIMQHVTMMAVDDIPKRIPVAHPFAMLYTAVKDCDPFATFLLDRLRSKPATPENPWRLVLYTDEVTPGNPLATRNDRKFQAMYWSFLELGVQALSREEAWFTVMCEFSLVVNQLQAGLSQAVGEVIKLFFDPDGFSFSGGGIVLPFESPIRLFAKVGAIIQDGGAHKYVWHSRGDGASKFCLLCKNLFNQESHITDEDGTHLLACNVIKWSGLLQATSAQLRNDARWLEVQSRTVQGDAFTEMQQGLGITYHPRALLLDRALADVLDPVKVYVHDWMHAIFVDGVCNFLVYLLLEQFIQKGWTGIYGTFADFGKNWHWPSRYHRDKRHEIFMESRSKKHRDAKHIKCQASDMLTFLPVLAFFVQSVLMNLEGAESLKPQCEAFLALVNVVELILAAGRTIVSPQKFLEAVEIFLALFAVAYGFAWMTPKFHWLLHMPIQLQRLGIILNCFCLERKHRVPKRYATQIQNISKQANESLLSEVLCHHLSQLKERESFSFKIGLVSGKPPAQRALAIIRQRLGLDEECNVLTSLESRFSPVATCKQGDVLLFKSDAGGFKAGKVLLHCEVDGAPISIVEEFDALGRNSRMGNSIWKTRGEDAFKCIDTEDILDVVVYSKLDGDRFNILLPLEYR